MGGRREGKPWTRVGCGDRYSAVALSLAAEGACTRVVATDVSQRALSVAADNAESLRLGRTRRVREGPLFEPLEEGERFDIIVSNPPYIAESERAGLQPEVRDWEPRRPYSREDGLDVIRQLVAGAPEHLLAGGLLAFECGLGQAKNMRPT